VHSKKKMADRSDDDDDDDSDSDSDSDSDPDEVIQILDDRGESLNDFETLGGESFEYESL